MKRNIFFYITLISSSKSKTKMMLKATDEVVSKCAGIITNIQSIRYPALTRLPVCDPTMSYVAYNPNSQELSYEEISSIGASCAAKISQHFDNHNIPNLLWGRLALGLVGEWTKDPDVEFIIPDEKIEKAADLLTARDGWERCTSTECPQMKYRHRQVPHIHIHMPDEGEQSVPWWTIICLHKKSELVWWMDDLKVKHISPDDKVLTISHGWSVSWNDKYPVAILQPSALVKALLLLLCRDWRHPHYWDIEWKRMLEGLMDGYNYHDLRPKYQTCWTKVYNHYRQNDVLPWQPILDLRAILRKKRRLPPPFIVPGFEAPRRPSDEMLRVGELNFQLVNLD
ncbi:uncharacterized protein ACLA_061700 [Aspergillus clavatus NRRL 1]|uniref:Uncharacterized protein n=1 Tax=Aspergillus clavatus (strain ATCC 1007 / CBS 513.65 / DSM 816 / NCTC 3887 / NRRL 1 / QM 1276 / 107) TaxID=344612 RepID=A1CCF1_ASPCL|nr:uncharacterized protein ACLA_061700 [Aspergillus clavatus NRRL 1]EAW12208.1 hypothetical protein ACLA_061700 [Aspergillus clavatus NRRL 1]